MSTSDEYFRQLERGARPRSYGTIHEMLHRIPSEPKPGIGQVKIILDHIAEVALDGLETIDNIFRWHGGNEMKEGLRLRFPDRLKFLEELRELLPDEDQQDGEDQSPSTT